MNAINNVFKVPDCQTVVFGHMTMQHFQRLVTDESLTVELQDVEPAAGAAEK